MFHSSLAALCGLILNGCETTTPAYERGEIAAISSLLVFDSPSDRVKLRQTRENILAFLESEESITEYVLESYAVKLAERHGKNPEVIHLVLRKIRAELELELGDKRAKEFLQGIADALDSLK